MGAQDPRQFFTATALPGAGLPHDRMSRLAARRAFVDLKTVFIAAVTEIPGRHGDWLRSQIRAAEEPVDLWLLRAPVLQTLASRDEAATRWRRQLRSSLETLFPDCEQASAFGAFEGR